MVPKPNGFIQEQSFVEAYLVFLRSNLWIILLSGPTGCGKSERVRNFYSRLNVPVLQESATVDTKPWDLTGIKELVDGNTEFVPAGLYKALKFGYPFILDEAFRLSSKMTSWFHTLRDHGYLKVWGTGEILYAAPGFKLILTANQVGYGDQTGFHPGDCEQDIAFLNGIASIACNYPDEKIETAIVQQVLENANPLFATEPTLVTYAPAMVAVANKVRSLFVGNDDTDSTDQRVEIALSTRTLVM